MPPQPIESRVENLERRVSQLEQLPTRIDGLASQISQLHTEMRAEFSAVRGEMAEQWSALREEMAEQGVALRIEFRTELRSEIGGLATQMRVLHEEVIGRIALLQEASPPPQKPRPRKK